MAKRAGHYRRATGTPGGPGFTERGWIVLFGGLVRGHLINPTPSLTTRPAGMVAGTQATPTAGYIDPTDLI